MVFHETSRGDRDATLLFPRCIPTVPLGLELANRRAGTREKDTAVSSFRLATLLERLQISANRRLAHLHRIPQIRDRNETMLANQFAQLGPPG